LTQYNALVVSHTKGLIKTATDAYKGGKIVLHDGKETEYEIEEVRESSTVTEPTFKLIETRTKYKNSNWPDDVQIKVVLLLPQKTEETN